jgi:hypothetical protein
MVQLIVIILLVAVGVVVWRFRQQRQENQLRENFPRRRVIEVSLPRGIKDSNDRMQKFYAKAVTATQGDPKARAQGLRQIDIVYLAEVKPEHTMADIRFLIYVDEDKMDAVKRSLKQVYEGMAHVLEIPAEHDPMEEIAMQLRPPKEEEKESNQAKVIPPEAAERAPRAQSSKPAKASTSKPSMYARWKEALKEDREIARTQRGQAPSDSDSA